MGLRLSLDDSLFLLLCFLVLTLNLPGPLFSAPTNMLPVYLSITQTFDYSHSATTNGKVGLFSSYL